MRIQCETFSCTALSPAEHYPFISLNYHSILPLPGVVNRTQRTIRPCLVFERTGFTHFIHWCIYPIITTGQTEAAGCFNPCSSVSCSGILQLIWGSRSYVSMSTQRVLCTEQSRLVLAQVFLKCSLLHNINIVPVLCQF